MRTPKAWLVVAVAWMLAGCNGFGPKADSPSPIAGAAEGEGMYTIQLKAFGYPLQHRLVAQQFKQRTEADTGWGGLFLHPDEDMTLLCWGRYARIRDAQGNLRKAKRYKAPKGANIYAMAIVVPMPGRDVGPSQWKLKNAPGLYSVLVAVFYDVPEAKYVGRKKFAVDYCRQLRKEGVPAYYHHGPNKSAVTVGSFPQSAIRIDRRPGAEKETIVNAQMKRIIDRFDRLAVNGREQRILVSTLKERKFESLTEIMKADKAERDHVLQGRNVGYQRPYPVRISGRKRSDDPRRSRPGYPKSR